MFNSLNKKRYAELIGNNKKIQDKKLVCVFLLLVLLLYTNKTKIITNLVYVHTATNPNPIDTFPIVDGNFQLDQEEV